MAEKLHFELVSPERLLASRNVYMVVVPGEGGDFGVLAGHAPFMSTIRPGVIDIYPEDGGTPERVFLDGGFAEVNAKGLTVLAEQAVPLVDLKVDDIAKQLAEAREDVNLAKTDIERAHAEKRTLRLSAMLAAVQH